MPAIRAVQLSLYRFDPSGFEIRDPPAGYYVSSEAEFRVLDSLWELRELVIDSTLEYSIIRIRNAASHEGLARFHPLP